MRTNTASFGVPSRYRDEYRSDPRAIMAQALQQQGGSTAPVQSHLEGIARALQGAIGGYQQKMLMDEYKGKADQYNQDVTKALQTAQTGVPAWTNPDTGQQAIPAVGPGLDALIAGLSGAQSPEAKEMGTNALIAKLTREPTEMERLYNMAGMSPEERAANARGILKAKETPAGMFPYMMGMTPYQQESLNVQREMADDRQAQREADKAAKRQEAVEKVSVPGFDIQEGIMPSATDADNLKKAAQAKDLLDKQIAELKMLVKQKGSELGFGSANSRMEQLRTNIMLNAKELENLGVLNGPDVSVLEKQLIDPTSLKSLIRSTDTMTKSYDDYSKYIDQRVESTAQARGYSKANPLSSDGVDTRPAVGDNAGFSEDEIFTAKKYGLTPAQVREQVKARQGAR